MEPEASQWVNIQPDIKVTKWDLDRLDHLLGAHATRWSWRAVEFLVRELMRATIVEETEVPASVVTMRSRVAFRVDDDISDQVVTLTYPGEREFYEDALSILTPTGAALIGLSEGQSISYAAPDGHRKLLTVLEVLSQPERSRHAGDTLSPRPS